MHPTLTRLGRIAADLLCPERCAACTAIVAAEVLFCHACRARVNALGAPECPRCGQPGGDAADACRHGCPAAVRRARAWAAYRSADADVSPVAAALVAFKYAGARRLGARLGTAVATRAPTPQPDLVVPVPLHDLRLRRRGYNQSAVLARVVARRLGRPLAIDALVRVRDTPSQTGLGVAERSRNVARAFVARPHARVEGRTVLLVDDVWTSGATAGAAAAALRAAGAAAVDVLTVARVL